MLSSLILQLMIDLMLVAVVAWLYLQQKKHSPQAARATDGGSSALNANWAAEWEMKWKEQEREIEMLREKLRQDLEKVQSLHERITRLVEQGVLTGGIFPSSLEEREIKMMTEKKERIEEIPSLKALEHTKERLKDETNFDLRTLLREQLA